MSETQSPGDGATRAHPSRVDSARAAGQLSIRSERCGAQHIIAVAGELDLATADALGHELRAVEATDAEQIVLDLSGLSFMDSTGLHLIVEADTRARTDSNRLRLLRGPPHVQRIFDLTDMTDRLPFAN